MLEISFRLAAGQSFRILSKLSKVLRWEEEWKTLTIRNGTHGIESSPDELSQHGLDLERLNISSVIFYNLSDLTTVSRINDRTFLDQV